jgi:hypothetical protein
MEIVRVTPVNSDSEDEETMERVTFPVVVEAVSDLTDTNEATGSADNVMNNPPNLVTAAEGDYVEETVKAGPRCLLTLGLLARMSPWTNSCPGLGVVPSCSLLSLTRLVMR